MIVVDASAVLAVLQREPGFEALSAKLIAESPRYISPVSMVEIAMVLARKFGSPVEIATAYLDRASIDVHPIDAAQARIAQHALLQFGKGRHPARLNLGDSFSYAAAKSLDAPLLYIGGDFGKTDIRSA